MGSSPIVSTRNVQVTALLFVRDRRRIARRAHCVPTTDGLWRVVVGTGGHGRFLAEALEVADDVRVLAVDRSFTRPRADPGPRYDDETDRPDVATSSPP